jgi:hypothetical protein
MPQLSTPDEQRLMLHVRLFGSLALRVGGSPVPTLDSARAQSLLAGPAERLS